MPPIWDPEEAQSSVYGDVEKHSEGMISFKYKPPSQADLDALKDTETYRALILEQGEMPAEVRPIDPTAKHQP